jgi:negative regulator of flagellin synthesis FlgM
MDIKGINNQYQYISNVKKNKAGKSESESAKDKLEISGEAKVLSNSQKEEAKKLEEITEKINSKFYDSDEVIEKVADKLLKDIKSK